MAAMKIKTHAEYFDHIMHAAIIKFKIYDKIWEWTSVKMHVSHTYGITHSIWESCSDSTYYIGQVLTVCSCHRICEQLAKETLCIHWNFQQQTP